MLFVKKRDKAEEIIEGVPRRKLEGTWKLVMYILGIIMSLFHIYGLAVAPMTRWYLYTFHIMFGLVMTLALYCARHWSAKKSVPWYDIILIITAVSAAVYMCIDAQAMAYRIGSNPNVPDLIFTGIIVILALECTRRTSGNILPAIAVFFLLYSYFGKYIPGALGHKGYRWQKTLSYMLSYDAILSTPLSASATMVFLFILFGAFLGMSGSGPYFIDMALSFAGARRGGPAKVAVISSALFGTVSGNSVANVVSTGAFTIPMMKSIGYRNHFAGAVEATASTGGQIMPPILGSAAFIMAQLIGLPYRTIMLASLIPALLYFFTVFVMVDLEAIKDNLVGLSVDKLPKKSMILKNIYMLLPLIVLIYMLSVIQASPIKAALYGIFSSVAVYVVNYRKFSLKAAFDALSSGAIAACPLIASCCTAGIIIGVLNMTGAGVKLASVIVSIAGNSLACALFLTMITSIILGMGLPTTASYIICAAVAAPALIQLGLSSLQTHMFIFYFACISAITPPVAMAAYAAASISKSSPMKVAFTSCKIGVSAFIVPYMFCYAPSLLAQGSVGQVIFTTLTAVLGCSTLSYGFQQQCAIPLMRLNKTSGTLLIVFSLLLIYPGFLSDAIGLTGCATVIGFNYILLKREKTQI